MTSQMKRFIGRGLEGSQAQEHPEGSQVQERLSPVELGSATLPSPTQELSEPRTFDIFTKAPAYRHDLSLSLKVRSS